MEENLTKDDVFKLMDKMTAMMSNPLIERSLYKGTNLLNDCCEWFADRFKHEKPKIEPDKVA